MDELGAAVAYLFTINSILMAVMQNARLAAQNTALKKNISVLFKTARLELDRRSDEIRVLREHGKQ